jgi:uncharacterized protein with beta-barrel porin domain
LRVDWWPTSRISPFFLRVITVGLAADFFAESDPPTTQGPTMHRFAIIAALALFVGCSAKETPEQAAERIRDTIAAMQSMSAEERQARSEAAFDRLSQHADSITKGMSFDQVNKMLGDPAQTRVKDGTISQAWSGTKDGTTITLAVRFKGGVVVDVMGSRKP